jgi:carbonic anhydrase
LKIRTLSVALVAIAIFTVAGDRAVADGAAGLESLTRLKAGNAHFVANPEDAMPVPAARRAELAKSQAPFATILSCADSRVAPEIVFHVGLGDLFVVRAAGNVSDRAILASVEYAVEHLHTPLVVVMGHESCGAVKAASETPASKSLGPNLDYMLKAIRPSVAAARTRPEAERLRAAILENVEETLNSMMKESAILREAGRAGHATFIGGYYELSSGKVYFSDPADVSQLTAPAQAAKPTQEPKAAHGPHVVQAPVAAPAAPQASKPAQEPKATHGPAPAPTGHAKAGGHE